MVRCAKRPLSPWQRLRSMMQQAGHRDAFQCFLIGQRREKAIQAAGQHGFPGPWRANQQQVVAAGRGDFQRALCLFLTQNILQIGRFGRVVHCRRRMGYR
ncbi:hypothetical protein D3C72_1486290 [compost metagenome]